MVRSPIPPLLDRSKDEGIGIFVVSTHNTDYVLVKGASLEAALTALRRDGYTIKHY